MRSETEIVLIVTLPQTMECQELLEAERSKEGFSLEPSSLKGAWLLDFGFLAPKTVKE